VVRAVGLRVEIVRSLRLIERRRGSALLALRERVGRHLRSAEELVLVHLVHFDRGGVEAHVCFEALELILVLRLDRDESVSEIALQRLELHHQIVNVLQFLLC